MYSNSSTHSNRETLASRQRVAPGPYGRAVLGSERSRTCGRFRCWRAPTCAQGPPPSSSTMGASRVLCCTIVSVVSCQVATAGSGASNLVLNPSFETAGGPPAAHWSCPDQYSRVTDEVHPPAKAALKQNNDDPKNYHTCTQTISSALPGRRYNASVWIRSANITGPGTGATICVE